MMNLLRVATRVSLWMAVAAGSLSGRASPGVDAPQTLRALYGLKAPESIQRANTALLLVDFQEEFFHGRLRLPEGAKAAAHAVQLLDWAHRKGILVVHVRNIVTRLGSPIFAADSPTSKIIPALTPTANDLVITKSMVGAFSHTDLDGQLRARQIDTLIVGGLMTHLAVQATAIDATVLGYRVLVASDAVATRALPGAGGLDGVDALLLQRAALASMADRVADVLPARSITSLPVL